MHFDILTIFPEFFDPFRTTGVLGRAVEGELIGIDVHDLRDWADNKWRQLDDEPYGGGPGWSSRPTGACGGARTRGSGGLARTVLAVTARPDARPGDGG